MSPAPPTAQDPPSEHRDEGAAACSGPPASRLPPVPHGAPCASSFSKQDERKEVRPDREGSLAPQDRWCASRAGSRNPGLLTTGQHVTAPAPEDASFRAALGARWPAQETQVLSLECDDHTSK